jgi:UDP-N-acetylglucosamine:LPS N-acetylglucosamine transferase
VIVEHEPARLVLFSRGRGRGHAVPDLSIIAALRSRRPGLDLDIASYAVGADTFRSHGHEVIDLGLPENSDFIDALLKASQVLQRRQYGLVVAHEEPSALVAARLAGVSAVYLCHWFTNSQDFFSASLRCADHIVFLGEDGAFDEPAEARGRIAYTGTFVRPLAYQPADRGRARGELGIAPAETVVLVLHGSPTDAVVPINALVLSAFDALPQSPKTLVWIAGRDREGVAALVRGRSDVRVLDTDWLVERWMVASDVAITKGTYNIGLELAALGVPSISLSNGHNYMDDLLLQRIPSNRAFWLGELTSDRLATAMNAAIVRGRLPPNMTWLRNGAARRAADLIDGFLSQDPEPAGSSRRSIERAAL